MKTLKQQVTACVYMVAMLMTTGANAGLISVDLSGVSSGSLINGIGADFAQTFSGQTVSGTSITGSPTGPLTLAPSGSISVASWNPSCSGL